MGKIANRLAWMKQKRRQKAFLNDMQRRFLTDRIEANLSTLHIPESTQIYAAGEARLRIGDGMTLGNHCVIDANDSYGIYIGENLLAADDVYFRGGNHDYSFSELPFQKRGHCAKRIEYRGGVYSIVVEDNVWLGRGATVISGAHIGKGCVIGAGAVVKETIPEYSIVIGNPAQIVSNRRKHPNFDDRDDIGIFA